MSIFFKKTRQQVDGSPMTSSLLVDDPEGQSPEILSRTDSVGELFEEAEAARSPEYSGQEPLSSTSIPHFGTLHFDESVAGLSFADVSVVLVGDFPVAVPIPRSLAETCGFVVLDVEDDVLRSIGVVEVIAQPEPAPSRAVLPTHERARLSSSADAFRAGDASIPPRTASEVSEEIGSATLASLAQRPIDLAPAPLALLRGLEADGDQPIHAAEPIWDKLARRSPDLAVPSTPFSVEPDFVAVDTDTALPDDVEGLQCVDDIVDVARPFATNVAKRVDVGFVDAQSWPEVERRLSERSETSADSGDFDCPGAGAVASSGVEQDRQDAPVSDEGAVQSQGAERTFTSGLRICLEEFVIDEGQLCVIFDSTGTAHTPLCRLLAGFEPIDRGRLRVGLRFMETLSDDDRLIREAGSIAFADNKPLMVGDLTVAENLELPLLISRRDPGESRQLVLDTLADFEMDFLADRLVQEMPKSEMVRLGVLRAILSGEVVVLDDPAVGGDTLLRNEIIEWIRVATNAGITVVYATAEFDISARLGAEPNAVLYELSTELDQAFLRPIRLGRS